MHSDDLAGLLGIVRVLKIMEIKFLNMVLVIRHSSEHHQYLVPFALRSCETGVSVVQGCPEAGWASGKAACSYV